MRYPDGTTVRVGDLVWWDGGLCLGYVQVIAELKEEYEDWGLELPHIFIENIHPFDPSIRIGVGHPERCFDGEGISPLSPDELVEFRRATAAALELVAPEYRSSSYSVMTDIQQGQVIGWVFTFIHDRQEVQTVRVPANL